MRTLYWWKLPKLHTLQSSISKCFYVSLSLCLSALCPQSIESSIHKKLHYQDSFRIDDCRFRESHQALSLLLPRADDAAADKKDEDAEANAHDVPPFVDREPGRHVGCCQVLGNEEEKVNEPHRRRSETELTLETLVRGDLSWLAILNLYTFMLRRLRQHLIFW